VNVSEVTVFDLKGCRLNKNAGQALKVFVFLIKARRRVSKYLQRVTRAPVDPEFLLTASSFAAGAINVSDVIHDPVAIAHDREILGFSPYSVGLTVK